MKSTFLKEISVKAGTVEKI